MRLWAVTMVRDELDILPYTLAHLANEGVAGITVADNLSTDGTWEWLQSLSLDCELDLLRDEEVGYYQAAKMTRLAHRGFEQHGATWVLPFDADELWYNAARQTSLHVEIADVPAHVGCLLADLHNYFPTSNDHDSDNPYVRITRRDPVPAPLPKVIVRANANVAIVQGNHGATGLGAYVTTRTPITVAHFPWRSVGQFVRKARNGAEAYRATDLPEAMGAHWRGYGDVLDQFGETAVAGIYREWFEDPPLATEEHHAPWCRPYNSAPTI